MRRIGTHFGDHFTDSYGLLYLLGYCNGEVHVCRTRAHPHPKVLELLSKVPQVDSIQQWDELLKKLLAATDREEFLLELLARTTSEHVCKPLSSKYQSPVWFNPQISEELRIQILSKPKAPLVQKKKINTWFGQFLVMQVKEAPIFCVYHLSASGKVLPVKACPRYALSSLEDILKDMNGPRVLSAVLKDLEWLQQKLLPGNRIPTTYTVTAIFELKEGKIQAVKSPVRSLLEGASE